jgi:hypothetical protein
MKREKRRTATYAVTGKEVMPKFVTATTHSEGDPVLVIQMPKRNKEWLASDKLWKRAFDATKAARVAKAKWEKAHLAASEAWANAANGTPSQYVYRAPKKSGK